jgi:prefoldin alpha subunit
MAKQEEKNKEESQAETQQKLMHLQMLSQQMKQAEQQVETFDNQLIELESVKQSLTELGEVKKGTDLFVPASGGIFVKATIQETNKLLVNVGSNIVVAKTVKETVGMIDEQIKEIGNLKTQVSQQMGVMGVHLQTLQQDLMTRVQG